MSKPIVAIAATIGVADVVFAVVVGAAEDRVHIRFSSSATVDQSTHV